MHENIAMAHSEETNGHTNGYMAKVSQQNGNASLKPAIERGASWGYRETGHLLNLWGQDMVQRQLTNSKRTRHVWEKIAENIREHGYDRTADQVRTRVFNMVAEYRRILKDKNNPERKKKCVFFDAIDKIYQAKDSTAVDNVMLNYDSEENFNSDCIDLEVNGDLSDSEEKNEIFSYVMSPSNSYNPLNGSSGNEDCVYEQLDDLFPPPKRSRREDNHIVDSYLNAHTSIKPMLVGMDSGLLNETVLANLSKMVDVMREWIDLDRERLAHQVIERREEKERNERREKNLTDLLNKLIEATTKQNQSNTDLLNKLVESLSSRDQLNVDKIDKLDKEPVVSS